MSHSIIPLLLLISSVLASIEMYYICPGYLYNDPYQFDPNPVNATTTLAQYGKEQADCERHRRETNGRALHFVQGGHASEIYCYIVTLLGSES